MASEDIRDVGGASYPNLPTGTSSPTKSFSGDVNTGSRYPDVPGQGSAYQAKSAVQDVNKDDYYPPIPGESPVSGGPGKFSPQGIGPSNQNPMDVNKGSYPPYPSGASQGTVKPSSESMPSNMPNPGKRQTGGWGSSNYSGYP